MMSVHVISTFYSMICLTSQQFTPSNLCTAITHPPSRQLCVSTDIDLYIYIYIFMIEINSFELIISKTKFHSLRHL